MLALSCYVDFLLFVFYVEVCWHILQLYKNNIKLIGKLIKVESGIRKNIPCSKAEQKICCYSYWNYGNVQG